MMLRVLGTHLLDAVAITPGSETPVQVEVNLLATGDEENPVEFSFDLNTVVRKYAIRPSRLRIRNADLDRLHKAGVGAYYGDLGLHG